MGTCLCIFAQNITLLCVQNIVLAMNIENTKILTPQTENFIHRVWANAVHSDGKQFPQV